jgi:hypothetical protein
MKNNSEEKVLSASDVTVSRRKFFGKLGTAAVGAAAFGALGIQSPAFGQKVADDLERNDEDHHDNDRVSDAYDYRKDMARAERIDVGTQRGNGDERRYTDFSGSYTKGLLHNALGVPNGASFLSLRAALRSGDHDDFANIIVGTPGGGGNSKLNGPQGAIAFDLEGLDSHATVIPASPTTRSAQTAAEQVEHYWAGLVRDVPFADFGTNPLVGRGRHEQYVLRQ